MAILDNQWVIFRLAGNLYGLPVSRVKEMTLLTQVTHIPETPPYVLGTMRLRDKVLAVMDLRVRLGLTSLETENQALVEMLSAREQDHVRWLRELEQSVVSGTEFRLARDPHKCAFGKWFDAFRTNDLILANEVKKFDQPHRRIHALADRALDLRNGGRAEEASRMIEETRHGDLAAMVRLFADLREMVKQRTFQVVVIVEDRERLVGLAVDEILSVSRVGEERMRPMPNIGLSLGTGYFTGVAESGQAGQSILLLDAEKVIGAE